MPVDNFNIDNDLLLEIAEGNEQAFNILFNRHWDKLYNYLFRIVKSREVAEEICMDVFTKLWIGKDLIKDIKNMDGFLFVVAHNKAMDFFKYAARNTRLQKAISNKIEYASDGPGTDAKLLNDEMKQVLKEAIEHLSPQRKIIFKLSREEGLTHEEIAEQLGLSLQTVKNTITRSLSRIRSFLEKKGVDPTIILWFIMTS